MTPGLSTRKTFGDPPGPPKHRILLVDDEEAILFPIARYFRTLRCSVDLAPEPDQAITLLQSTTYDLVILDLRLTKADEADGLEVLRHLRERLRKRTSVIVLSAYISPEVEAEAVRLGAHAVLRKPQNLADLAQIAFAVMGEGS